MVMSNPAFKVNSTVCKSILPGANCTLNLKYVPAPSATGDLGTLQIADNAPISPQIVTLTGYINRPTINIYYLGFNFGDEVVGTKSGPILTNIITEGTLPLHITKVVGTGDFAGVNHCPTALQPYTQCQLGATFTPSTVGPVSGSLLVYDDAPGSPQVIQLEGNGLATYPTPVITFVYPNSAAVSTTPLQVSIDGTDIFPTSKVLINGKVFRTSWEESQSLCRLPI
jgi:hypothetical protein